MSCKLQHGLQPGEASKNIFQRICLVVIVVAQSSTTEVSFVVNNVPHLICVCFVGTTIPVSKIQSIHVQQLCVVFSFVLRNSEMLCFSCFRTAFHFLVKVKEEALNCHQTFQICHSWQMQDWADSPISKWESSGNITAALFNHHPNQNWSLQASCWQIKWPKNQVETQKCCWKRHATALSQMHHPNVLLPHCMQCSLWWSTDSFCSLNSHWTERESSQITNSLKQDPWTELMLAFKHNLNALSAVGGQDKEKLQRIRRAKQKWMQLCPNATILRSDNLWLCPKSNKKLIRLNALNSHTQTCFKSVWSGAHDNDNAHPSNAARQNLPSVVASHAKQQRVTDSWQIVGIAFKIAALETNGKQFLLSPKWSFQWVNNWPQWMKNIKGLCNC